MGFAVCYECFEDPFLKNIVKDDGKPRTCSVCGGGSRNAFSVKKLGRLLEPIMREHVSPGPLIRTFADADDDNGELQQTGDPMSYFVQLILGQYFDFEDVIIDAICEAEDVRPQDGEEAYWDETADYVESRVRIDGYLAEWDYTQRELKHSRRFFSKAAQNLFRRLFQDLDDLRAFIDGTEVPVVQDSPPGTEFYRARIADSRSLLTTIYGDPLRHVGPPPKEAARAGRMNAEGVVAFYGALDEDTCLAEMRPALGSELAVITVSTTKTLRLLDFRKLERARGSKVLSYFQPDFTEQVERQKFLRHLHRLISQPVIPGHEADYLITQTMAEYLAHVHKPRFDGILFSSVQRAEGVNVVLFPDPSSGDELSASAFGLAYVDKSVRTFSTKAISYEHKQRYAELQDDGELWVDFNSDEMDEWDEP